MNRVLFCCVYFCVLGIDGTPTIAQDVTGPPEWTANKEIVAQLGNVFADSRISIRLPRSFQRVERPDPPELSKIGVYNYGWTPEGVFPSPESLFVMLTPYATPSPTALDKMVESMKKGVEQRLENVEFSVGGKGLLRGIEVCAGEYTTKISGENLTVLYLVGIDRSGSFGVTAMLPSKEATPGRLQELSAAMLTFQLAGSGEDTSKLAAVKAKADEVAKAFFERDYEKSTDLTYPKLIELMGGRDAVIARMKAEVEQGKKAGLKIDEYTVFMPTKIIRDGTKEFVFVSTTMKMSAPGAKVTTKSYLFGISNDAGNTWTFLTGSKLDNQLLRAKILPDFPRDLELPKKEAPQVIADTDRGS